MASAWLERIDPQWKNMLNHAPGGKGKYKMGARLGKGTLGVVYNAYDLDRRRAVAMKTITAIKPRHFDIKSALLTTLWRCVFCLLFGYRIL